VSDRPRPGTNALSGLCLRTERLELRVPTEDELPAFAALAELGIHPPEEMPFLVPWTDGVGAPGFVEEFVGYHSGLLRDARPERWGLEFGVFVDGAPAGFQGVHTREFPTQQIVSTGSWLGRRFQQRGIGTEMRVAVLAFAFDGLGARAAESAAFEGNTSSARVSEKLGYLPTIEVMAAPRGVPVRQQCYRLDREAWLARPRPAVEVDGLEPALQFLRLR